MPSFAQQGWRPSHVECHLWFHQGVHQYFLSDRWWNFQRSRVAVMGDGHSRKWFSRKRRRCWSRVSQEPWNTWPACSRANLCGVRVLMSTRSCELSDDGNISFRSQYSPCNAPSSTHKEKWGNAKEHHGCAAQQVPSRMAYCHCVHTDEDFWWWGEILKNKSTPDSQTVENLISSIFLIIGFGDSIKLLHV